jgi:hypothetical protein
MTAKADTTRSGAKIQKNKASACIVRLLSQVPLPRPLFPLLERGRARSRRGAPRSLAPLRRGPRPAYQKAPVDNARLSTGHDQLPSP